MRKSWVVFFLFDRSLLTLGLILQSEFIISSKIGRLAALGSGGGRHTGRWREVWLGARKHGILACTSLVQPILVHAATQHVTMREYASDWTR